MIICPLIRTMVVRAPSRRSSPRSRVIPKGLRDLPHIGTPVFRGASIVGCDLLDLLDWPLCLRMELIDSRKFFALSDRWFGERGVVPHPMSDQVRHFLIMQSMPE
jgi:hypothetical protein